MVNQSNIFKKIGYILNELQDQYEFLSANPDQLSELELELFLANANFLTDHVQIVKKMYHNQPVKELPAAEKPEALNQSVVVEDDDEEQTMVISTSVDVTPPTFEFIINDHKDQPHDTVDIEEVVKENEAEERVDYFEEQEIEEVTDESPEEEVQSPKEEEQLFEKEKTVEEVGPEPFLVSRDEDIPAEPIHFDPTPAPVFTPTVTEVPSQAPVAPQPHPAEATEVPAAKLTLNELLAGQKSSSINDDTSRPVITDLKKAVNLNEKLLYIKDLFNGYNLAYSEAIDIVNKLPDFKSADAFLKNNYAVKNNWEAKQNTVDKFYDLIRQRFPD